MTRRVRLGDVADLRGGFAFESRRFSDDPDDVPLVKGSNLGHRRIRWSEGPWWPRAEAARLDGFWLTAGDVVLAMDRPVVRGRLKYAWLSERDPRALLVQRVGRLRGSARLDQGFLRQIVGSPAFRDHVERMTTGVNVPHISGDDVLRFELDLPPLAAQRRIARVLSAHDALIDNAARRVALLAELVATVYREWFVHRRLPGGMRRGWRQVELAEVARVNPETLSPRAAPERIRYVAIKDVSTGRIDRWTELPAADAPRRARRLVRDGDVIWATVRPANRAWAAVIEPPPDLVVSTGLAVLRPAGVGTGFLYAATTDERFVQHMIAIARGAAYPAVRAADLAAAVLQVPPAALLDRFEAVAGPALRAMHALHQQTRRLHEARELLLPRLLDGRLTA